MDINEILKKLTDERDENLKQLQGLSRVSDSWQWINIRVLEEEINFLESFEEFKSEKLMIYGNTKAYHNDLELEQVILLANHINDIMGDSTSYCYVHKLFDPGSTFYELACCLDCLGVGNANHVMFRIKSILSAGSV